MPLIPLYTACYGVNVGLKKLRLYSSMTEVIGEKTTISSDLVLSDLVRQELRILLLLARRIYFAADRGESRALKDIGHGIANFLHYDASPTGVDVHTFVALSKPRFAGTRKRGNGTVDHSNHRGQGDL